MEIHIYGNHLIAECKYKIILCLPQRCELMTQPPKHYQVDYLVTGDNSPDR